MNTSASVSGLSVFDFLSFDFTTPLSGKNLSGGLLGKDEPQSTQDADLLRELSFIPGLKEILMLRQVHALEHATVWVLSGAKSNHVPTQTSANVEIDNESLGGLSTERGFYLYGEVNISDLRRAVTLARHRLTTGEWDLAVHPRCGTNLSVAMLLTGGLAFCAHLLLPRGPIEQLIGLGIAATTAAEIAPDMGELVQRYLTTAIPFNLTVENITLTRDVWGREGHFIQVRWRE